MSIDLSIIGRGAREGASLVRNWFQELDRAASENQGAAYVFVMGSLNEIFKSFDLPSVFPEINSLQTAVRHVAHEYLREAEDFGYSPDICAYVKADVAVQRRGGLHPMGRIPKPALAVCTNACNTYIKWAEIWERMYGCPVFTLDIPGSRACGRLPMPGDPLFENDRRYVEAQLYELIALCEQITKKTFNIDKLRESMKHANTLSAAWRQVLSANHSRPAVFNALTDGTIYLGVANSQRGSPEGARFFQNLAEEMHLKSTQNIGTSAEECYRLLFVGVPCYPIFRRFNDMFTRWGGTFVCSTYLWFASGGAHLGHQYDLSSPLSSLAEKLLLNIRSAVDSMFYSDIAIQQMAKTFQIDGVVFHPIKSCRTVSTGLADSRRMLMKQTDIPSLFIESDMMDRQVVSEAQLKNRIDAFFEGLASRRNRVKNQEKEG
jgi:benzoyl-CoA reductase subunit B